MYRQSLKDAFNSAYGDISRVAGRAGLEKHGDFVIVSSSVYKSAMQNLHKVSCLLNSRLKISDFGEFVVAPSDDVFVIFKRGTNLSPHPVAEYLAHAVPCTTVACDEQMYDSLSLDSMRELAGVAAEKYKILEHPCGFVLNCDDLALDLKTRAAEKIKDYLYNLETGGL